MKTVLITGSSKGLGKALALAFAKSKHAVILHGRDWEGLEKTAREIKKCGTCEIIRGDINSSLGINKLASIAESKKIDVFINNAGMHLSRAFSLCEEQEIKDVLNTNLVSPILLTHRIFRQFKNRKAGLIININSLAGKEAAFGESIYCASKHGLRGFSKSLQHEATGCNVRVIDVYLGRMQTALHTGNKDYGKYIDTKEAADSILHIARNYKSMRITEIDILRRIY